jgi:acetyltransferase
MKSPSPKPDPTHDLLQSERPQPLDALFAPKTVALIGATETTGTVGAALARNLCSDAFAGTVFPVNPKRATICGKKSYPSIAALPAKPDLAIIATPAVTVPGLIGECINAKIKGAIIISAGFKETGAAGAELERQILTEARRDGMPILGPNCLGVMVPRLGFNATFASRLARPGTVGFLSQSGALCTAILDWSFPENVGFSSFVSIGSMLDVNWGDLIYYLGDDPHTKSIVIYMESIGDARSFLSAAREVALTKPIIVIKVGRTAEAAKAAASHTGSMTGSDEVLQAAFRRVGVLRVNTVAELFNMAEVLAKQPRPRDPRLAIVTNAGGPGVLATDMLITSGGQLAELSPESFQALNDLLPAPWSHNNPVDILGDAGPDRYAKAIEIVAKDPKNDGVLVILTPQTMTDPTGTARQLKPFARLEGKPILASWMGGSEVEEGRAILNACDIPTFDYPDAGARAFFYMWRYAYNLRALYETPGLVQDSEEKAAHRTLANKIIQDVRSRGRTVLTEYESKQVLASYDIPVLQTRVAFSEQEAAAIAHEIGYPVVLKLHSETITHKTDVGGVQLNLRDASAVRRAWKTIQSAVTAKAGREHFQGVTVQPMVLQGGYELILGSSLDPQFGPVLLFGTGGQLVEVFRDRALALPPLNGTLARRMMEQTRIYTALQGVRGRAPVDLAALENLLVRFSQLVVEQPWVAEIDVNPLLVSADRMVALDARVIVHGQDISESRLPKPAIRPYPNQYVRPRTLKDGSEVLIRPIRPEDEPLMVKFHRALSEQSVYYRYLGFLKLDERIAHERLTRICFNDYDREIALVAQGADGKAGQDEILGVARLSKCHGLNEAEFALVIADRWQHRGLGSQLLKILIQVGRTEKLNRIVGNVLPENHRMQQLCRKLGFKIHKPIGEGECVAELIL